jgi:hypothetical protein
MSEQRVGDLEVGQDLAFQRGEWTVQRIAWVVMALLLVAALIGLFGRGPIASATAGDDDDPIRVSYKRLERKAAPSALEIRAAPGQAQNGQLEVWIDADYLGGVQVQDISPEPQEMRAAGDQIVYAVLVEDPSQPTLIVVQLEHERIGRTMGRVGLLGGPGVSFGQFVFP